MSMNKLFLFPFSAISSLRFRKMNVGDVFQRELEGGLYSGQSVHESLSTECIFFLTSPHSPQVWAKHSIRFSIPSIIAIKCFPAYERSKLQMELERTSLMTAATSNKMSDHIYSLAIDPDQPKNLAAWLSKQFCQVRITHAGFPEEIKRQDVRKLLSAASVTSP